MSPGLAQTMPNRPVSLTSPLSFSTWHADHEPPSPAYTRFPEPVSPIQDVAARQTSRRPAAPPVPDLPAEYRGSTYRSSHQVVQPAPPTFSDDTRSVKSWKSGKSWLSRKGKKGKKAKSSSAADKACLKQQEKVLLPEQPEEQAGLPNSTPAQTEGADRLQAILDLDMGPNCLAVVYNSHESGICQIYDAQGNEVSYTFGGIDHFKSLYELLDVGDAYGEPKGAWKKMKGWSRRMHWKLNWSRRKTYKIEVWTLKLREEGGSS